MNVLRSLDRRRRRVRQAARRPPHAGADHQASGPDGRWGPVFGLPNVAIHTTLLPDGKVLFWGRRDDPARLDERALRHPVRVGPGRRGRASRPRSRGAPTAPRSTSSARGTPTSPTGGCSSRAATSPTATASTTRAPTTTATNTWTPLPAMNGGRWYPTATSLADGRVLVISGSAAAHGTIEVNADPQITDGEGWAPDRRLRRAAALPAHARRPGRAGPHGGLQRHDLPARHPRRRHLDTDRRTGERVAGVRALGDVRARQGDLRRRRQRRGHRPARPPRSRSSTSPSPRPAGGPPRRCTTAGASTTRPSCPTAPCS